MTRHVVAFALCAVMALLLGCATDQRADVDMYRAIADPPGEPAALASGEPLSLERAMRLTATYNEQLAIQGERYIQALADRQRLAAALLPTVDLFASAALRENTANAGIVQSAVGVRGQYRLMTGMSDLSNVRAAEARIDSQRWLILDLRETLLVQVARAYYDALRAERLGSVLRSSLLLQEARLADARARSEVGFARPLDVAQIEAQLSRTKAQLIAAQRAQGEARGLLKLLTNADVAGSALTDDFRVPPAVPAADELQELARRFRQDILAARSEADAARSQVDAAIGEYYPSITLNLDYFLLRGPDMSAANPAAILGVNLPIFSAGEIAANVRFAWSLFREAVLQYRLREREAFRDVEVAELRVRTTRDLLAELLVQVRVAQDAVDLAEASYQAGLGTNLERVVAQDVLLTAELEAVSAEFTLKTAYIELLRACGRLSRDMMNAPLPEPPADRAPPDSPVLDRSSQPVRADTAPAGAAS